MSNLSVSFLRVLTYASLQYVLLGHRQYYSHIFKTFHLEIYPLNISCWSLHSFSVPRSFINAQQQSFLFHLIILRVKNLVQAWLILLFMRHQQSSLGGIGLANGLQSLRKHHLMCGLLEGVAGKFVSTETIDPGSYTWLLSMAASELSHFLHGNSGPWQECPKESEWQLQGFLWPSRGHPRTSVLPRAGFRWLLRPSQIQKEGN